MARSPVSDATERIQRIIEQAEIAADGIISQAENEAEQYVSEARGEADREAAEHARALAALSESLIAQAELLSRESQRLLATVARPEPESRNLVEIAGPDRFDDTEMVARAGTDEDPHAVELLELQPEQIADRYSAGARLLAMQMAVSGSGRADIRVRLVDDFGIADPDRLLDSILGHE